MERKLDAIRKPAVRPHCFSSNASAETVKRDGGFSETARAAQTFVFVLTSRPYSRAWPRFWSPSSLSMPRMISSRLSLSPEPMCRAPIRFLLLQ